MGASRSNVSSAINGRESVLTDQFVMRFCVAYPQISYMWLQLGRGEMISDQGKTILERIREVLKIERRSASDLAEEYGGALTELQEYLDNDEEPNVKMVDEFCKALKVNRDWVLRGVGDIKSYSDVEIGEEKESSYSFLALTASKGKKDAAMRPRLPVSAVTGGLHAYINGDMKGQYVMMPVIKHFSDYDFTMFIRDDSMNPKYERGDEIALKEVSFIKEWGKEYALDTHDGILFKRIYEEGDKIRCVSFNKEYHDVLIPKDAVIGYFRFVGLIRVWEGVQ
jgi:SOS-response transcriptional repressor LexA